MKFPIRYQFMLPLFAVALTSLLAVGVFNSRLATRQTKSRIEKQLQGVAAALEQSSYPLTDAVLRQMGELAGAEFVLTDATGKKLASGGTVSLEVYTVDSQTVKNSQDVTLGPEVIINEVPYFHSSVWVQRRPRVAEPTVLHILFAKNEFDAAWREAFIPSILVGLITVVAVALVTHLVAGRVSRVLARLGRDVERLADGDFSPVNLPSWKDETQELAAAINQTAGRLAEYEAELCQAERMRTVTMLGAGLAHEMRNAATGCRMAVDLHAETCECSQNDETLDVARRQLQLMENRLQQLLQLGKEPSSVADRRIDFAALISESVSLLTPAAHHANVRVEWQQPNEKITVCVDAELLSQVVMNLLLNALDATTQSQALENVDGRVSIELSRNETQSKLTVADSGNGPDANIKSAVFEPFATSKPEGVGLGLAVAKRVVESYGGTVSWSRDAGVTKFSVQLPLAAEEVRDV